MLKSNLFRTVVAATLAFGLMGFGAPASKAADAGTPTTFYYMQYGTAGESTDPTHKGWTDLSGFTWTITSQTAVAAGSGAAVGKTTHGVFTVTTSGFSASSLAIMENLVKGAPQKTVVVELVDPAIGGANGTVRMRYTFTDVYVTSYSVASGDALPTETIGLQFKSYKIEYAPLISEGKVGKLLAFGWNIAQNKPV